MTSTEGRPQPLVTVVWIRCYETSDLQLKNNQKLVPRISCDWFSRSLVRTKCDYSLLAMQPSRGFPRSAPTDPNSGPEASCSLAALLWISVRYLATPSPQAYSKHQHLQHTRRAFLSCRFIITCVRPVTSPLRWQKGHSASLGTELV